MRLQVTLSLLFIGLALSPASNSFALDKYVACSGRYSHSDFCENVIEITYPTGEADMAFESSCTATRNDFRALALATLCLPVGDARRCDYITLRPADTNFNIGVFGITCPR